MGNHSLLHETLFSFGSHSATLSQLSFYPTGCLSWFLFLVPPHLSNLFMLESCRAQCLDPSPSTLNSLMASSIIMALNINSVLMILKLNLHLLFPPGLHTLVDVPAYLIALLRSRHLELDMYKTNPWSSLVLSTLILLPTTSQKEPLVHLQPSWPKPLESFFTFFSLSHTPCPVCQ